MQRCHVKKHDKNIKSEKKDVPFYNYITQLFICENIIPSISSFSRDIFFFISGIFFRAIVPYY